MPNLRDWLSLAVALLCAVAVALLIAQLLMSPPRRDLLILAGYLAGSGAATIIAGALAMRAIDRAADVSIRAKSAFAALAGTAVALLNVLIVAQLMFVSTAHDLRLLLALIVFGAIVTVFFSVWVASNTAARAQRIALAVRRLASGDYTEYVAVAGRDELASLAADVNILAQRLAAIETERAAVDAERRELTASISHDLRTPLASIRAMLEALDDDVVEDHVEVRRYYATMRREIDRLSRMINDLFELPQIDAGALRLDTRPVAIQEVLSEVVDAMQAQARRQGIGLTLEAPNAPIVVPMDGERMERAIANLVRNALEHTPHDGAVHVSASSHNGCAMLAIRDTGDGISPEDLEHIWARFYRAEQSRTRRPDGAEGAGLGLAITRGIIEAHGGTIDATSQPGQGTTMTIRLPANGSTSRAKAPIAVS